MSSLATKIRPRPPAVAIPALISQTVSWRKSARVTLRPSAVLAQAASATVNNGLVLNGNLSVNTASAFTSIFPSGSLSDSGTQFFNPGNGGFSSINRNIKRCGSFQIF